MILEKIKNRFIRLGSSGSPLLYFKKAAAYSLKFPHVLKRKRLARNYSKNPDTLKTNQILEEHGFLKISDLIDPALFRELKALVNEKINSGMTAKYVVAREYFGEVLSQGDFAPESIFMRFALQENILKLIATNFAQVPVLFSVSVLTSKPTKNQEWLESQLWHRDYDDSKILKLFTYVNDVTDKNGPFTFIPPIESKKVGRDFFPKRIHDNVMDKTGSLKSLKEISGPAGTSFLIDTGRCYHMGSRCRESERIAFIATYTTCTSLNPPTKFSHKSNLFSEMQNLVLGH
jgi:hypothetical protein